MTPDPANLSIPSIDIPNELVVEYIPDDEAVVAKMLADAKSQMQELKDLMAPFVAMQKEAHAAADELIRKAREFEDKARQAKSAMFDAQRAVRRLENNANALDRKAARLQALKKFQEQSFQLANKFDEITAGAPWREWAKEHQIVGAHTMAASRRCILGDAPRFGKTLTTLATADMLQAKKILVLTPGQVTGEFAKQIKQWAPHRALVMNLAGKSKSARNTDLRMLQMPSIQDVGFVVVCNYEAWRKDNSLIDRLIDTKFDTVILDEAHELANPKTSAFKGVDRLVYAENESDVAHPCSHCGQPVVFGIDPSEDNSNWLHKAYIDEHSSSHCILNEQWPNKHEATTCSVVNVFPLTGTLLKNKPQDMWPALYLVDKRSFPDKYHFERDYLVQKYVGGRLVWVFGTGGMDRLLKKLGNRYIRRDRTNSPEIDIPTPEIVVRELDFDFDEYVAQGKVLKDLNRAIIEVTEDKKIGINYTIALITRKRQAITWPHFEFKDTDGNVVLTVATDQSIKIDEIIRFNNGDRNSWDGMVPDLIGSGEKVVIASQFVGTLAEIERRCSEAGIECVNLGNYDMAERANAAHRFNAADHPVVMLGHYKVMGTGIPLDGANEVIILDEAWNPAGNDQMYDRIVRMGKTQKCQVTILRVKNSIDDFMAGVNEQKRDMIQGFNEKHDLTQDLLNSIQKGGLL